MSESTLRPNRRSLLAMSAAAATGALSTRGEARCGWQPDPALLAGLEAKNTSWIYRERDVKPYSVPDPLVRRGGARVATKEEWERSARAETLALLEEHVYGRSPGKPDSVMIEVTGREEGALGGAADLKHIAITSRYDGRSFTFPCSVFVPRGRRGPFPAWILINNRAVSAADPSRMSREGFWPVETLIDRGYATAVFRTNDVDADSKDESLRKNGVRGVWPEGGGKLGSTAWATLGAWAWGASRVLDYLQSEQKIHAERIGVVGHSRGGKTALWAGAQDRRFAIVVSNDSGCGGAALSRRIFGETVSAINRGFPYWFCENFKPYSEHEERLPVEQNQLLSLIAPRGLCVASADADFWADQRGEFLSLAHASPVYGLYGNPPVRPDEMPPLDSPLVRGAVAYHVRRGEHNLTAYDWERYADFADGFYAR